MRIEATAARRQSPAETFTKRPALPVFVSLLLSGTGRRRLVKTLPASISRTVRRAGHAVFGDEHHGWIRFAGNMLDAVVYGLNEDPLSRSGQSLRQLVAACWLMLCVLLLNNFAQIDLLRGVSRGWVIVYGTFGLLYLALCLVLVIGIVQDRRKWTTHR